MFLYLNFRKNAGLVGHHAFHKEDKVAPIILEEIRQLIATTKNEYGGSRACPDSKEVDSFLAGLYKPTIPQLRELIQKYEAWAAPFAGPALLHEIQEHILVKDSH
jgi:hypothetical protein